MEIFSENIFFLFTKCLWGFSVPRISVQKMQLPINEGEFDCPDVELYHAYLSSSIKYWKPTIGINYLIWTI